MIIISLGSTLGEVLELLGNSKLSVLVGESEVSEPLSALGVLVNSGSTWGQNLLSWLLVSGNHLSVWVSNDGGVNLLVEILASLCLGIGEALVPVGEMSLELLGVLLLHGVHVLGDVVSENSSSENGSIESGVGFLDISSFASLVGNDLSLLLGKC